MWYGTGRVRVPVVWLHRWVGLLIAAFLVLVGLTGSLLAFNTELERAFAPRLFAVEETFAVCHAFCNAFECTAKRQHNT